MKLKFISLLLFSIQIFAIEDPIVLNRQGVQNGREGNFTEALNNFDKSIDTSNKGLSKVYHNKGWVFEKKGEVVKALENYEIALNFNPNQIETLEKAGYLYYKSKKFNRAVELGERALKIDPENKEVIKWLKDAHSKRLSEKVEDIIEKEENEEKDKFEKDLEKEDKQTLFSVKYMGIAKAQYNLQEDKGFAYEKYDGLYVMDFPQMLNINITPTKNLEFNIETGTPYFGALMPEVANWQERVETIYKDKTVYLGIGVLGTHYINDNVYGESKTLHDYKAGLIVGKKDVKYSIHAVLYPKFFPRDTGQKENKTFDRSYFDILITLNYFDFMGIYTQAIINEFYFYDHGFPINVNKTIPISHYMGTYDFLLGISLFDKPSSKFIFKTELIERLYMFDAFNENPYEILNGQGFLGINRDKWFQGDPVSGFETNSFVIKFKFEERLNKNFKLFQNIFAEFVPLTREKHDFGAEIGLGFYY